MLANKDGGADKELRERVVLVKVVNLWCLEPEWD